MPLSQCSVHRLVGGLEVPLMILEPMATTTSSEQGEPPEQEEPRERVKQTEQVKKTGQAKQLGRTKRMERAGLLERSKKSEQGKRKVLAGWNPMLPRAASPIA